MRKTIDVLYQASIVERRKLVARIDELHHQGVRFDPILVAEVKRSIEPVKPSN